MRLDWDFSFWPEIGFYWVFLIWTQNALILGLFRLKPGIGFLWEFLIWAQNRFILGLSHFDLIFDEFWDRLILTKNVLAQWILNKFYFLYLGILPQKIDSQFNNGHIPSNAWYAIHSRIKTISYKMQNFTTTKDLITAVVPLYYIIPWLYFHHYLSLLWKTFNFELSFINKFVIFLKIMVKTAQLLNRSMLDSGVKGTRTTGPQKLRTGRGRFLCVNFNISN